MIFCSCYIWILADVGESLSISPREHVQTNTKINYLIKDMMEELWR
jgi:hypothetical protein